jgi:hypothetical protein
LWHIDTLLANDRETNNETTAVARQWPARNNGSTVGSSVFYVIFSEVISRDRPSSVKLVQWSGARWLMSEFVKGLLRFSPCEPLLLEAGSSRSGIIREPRVSGTSAVESRYQSTTGKDTSG